MTELDPRFALEASGRFIIQAWQDEAVAYDDLSGDTHLLEPLALTVITEIDEGAGSAMEIAQRIASDLDAAESQDAVDRVTEALSELRRIGMIVVVPIETR